MVSVRRLREFLLIWSAVFTVVAYANRDAGPVAAASIAAALLIAAVALFMPRRATALYSAWMAVGETMGNAVSKALLVTIFFLFFTPVAFVLRRIGSDPLCTTMDRNAKSWWVRRSVQPGSMRRQF